MKTYWFVFKKNLLVLQNDGNGSYTVPYCEEAPLNVKGGREIHDVHPLGFDTVKAFETEDENVPDNCEWCDLRASFYKLPLNIYNAAGKCREILYWDANTQYCSACGGKMHMHTDISKVCDKCGREVWPQLNTAVICLIQRGDDVLLVHAHNFRGNFYGLIAGFVETGENLEQALEREIKEETGLTVTNIRYYASQPWPYPCGLMCGFYADYVSGDIKLQKEELASGGWFNKDNMPELPGEMSIARRLINHWLEVKHAR